MKTLDLDFVAKIEAAHFRTNQDTGASENAIFIWNQVRQHIGLPGLLLQDLPAWCETHKKYHKINADYGCIRNIRD